MRYVLASNSRETAGLLLNGVTLCKFCNYLVKTSALNVPTTRRDILLRSAGFFSSKQCIADDRAQTLAKAIERCPERGRNGYLRTRP